MAASNDLRGWVMSAVSGVGKSTFCILVFASLYSPACVLGSSVICADLILWRFSRRKSFQIVHNNTFLSASLSLSAGVMVSLPADSNASGTC